MRRLIISAALTLVSAAAFAQQPPADEPTPKLDIYGFVMLDMATQLQAPRW